MSLAGTKFLMKVITVFVSTHSHDIPEIMKYKPQVSKSSAHAKRDGIVGLRYQLIRCKRDKCSFLTLSTISNANYSPYLSV